MAGTFTRAGIGAVSVNYRLAPAARLDEIVRQCRASISWLHSHGAEFGIDVNRIHIGGISEGGHLVGMVLAQGWHNEFDVPDDVFAGALALSGLYDLEPVRLSEPNEWIKLDAAGAERNSPLRHLPKNGCPLTVSYGGNETAEFKRQTDDYAAAWQTKGFPCRRVDMTACNHFDLPLQLMDPESNLTQAVFEQIKLSGKS
jgi:arylformamidase